MKDQSGALGTNIPSFLLTLTVLILVAILFPRHYKFVLDSECTEAANTTVNATCELARVENSSCIPQNANATTGPCTVGYILTDLGTCDTEHALSGTTCDSICYNPDAGTTCDSNGACTGNMTDCRAYCQQNSDCNVSLPFNTGWFGVNDTEAEVPIFWTYACLCYYNMAELFVLDLFWQEGKNPPLAEENFGVLVSGSVPCSNYLDQTFWQQYKDCLTVTRFLLDPNVTLYQYYLNYSDATTQFALCSITWNCAILNQSAIYIAPTFKRALHEDAMAPVPSLLATLDGTPVYHPQAEAAALEMLVEAKKSRPSLPWGIDNHATFNPARP